MPADFLKCVADGGKVITKDLGNGEYIKICFKDGKSYPGETMKKEIQKKAHENQAIRTLIPIGLEFAEDKAGGYELQVLKPGQWDHPAYGMVEITPEIQQEFADNFKRDLRAHSSTIGLPIDEEHYSDRGATGWIKDLINKGNEGLFAIVEWNVKGRELIKNAIYRFFSPEFYFQYEDPEDRRLYNNVLVGGALTNRPYFKGLNPVVLSENIIHKHMDLKEIVKKVFADLSDGEKSFITSHFSELTEDELTKFSELFKEGDVCKLADGSDGVLSPDKDGKMVCMSAKDAAAKKASEKDAADKKAKEEADKKKEEEEAAKKKAEEDAAAAEAAKNNGNNLGMSESKIKELQKQAEDGIKASEKLKKIEMSDKIDGFIYSETNLEKGKLPVSLKDKVSEFAMSLNESQMTKFFEIIEGMPSAKLFSELGESALAANDGSVAPKGVDEYSFNLDKKAKELMKANDKLTYQSALVMAEKELAKK